MKEESPETAPEGRSEAPEGRSQASPTRLLAILSPPPRLPMTGDGRGGLGELMIAGYERQTAPNNVVVNY